MTNPPTFDPYLQWLGIRDPDRPPNHYRLLGIELFEQDPAVIASAGDRQMAHVRTFQGGKYSAISQRVLNELSAARLCLLKPERKRVYDEQLQRRLKSAGTAALPRDAESAPRAAQIIQPADEAVSFSIEGFNPARRKRAKKKQRSFLPLAIIGLLILGLAAIVGWNFSTRPRAVANSKQPQPASPESGGPVATPRDPAMSARNAESGIPPAASPEISPVSGDGSVPAGDGPAASPETDSPAVVLAIATPPPMVDQLTSVPTSEPEQSPSDHSNTTANTDGASWEDLPDLRRSQQLEQRTPVPADAEIKSAGKEVREIFSSELEQAKSPDQQIALAFKLRSEAERSADHAAAQYALLDLAISLATTAGNCDEALESIHCLERRFDVDGWQIKADNLLKISRSPKVPKTDLLLSSLQEVAHDAAAAGRFSVASQLAKAAVALSKKSKDREAPKQAIAQEKAIQQARKDFEAAVAAIDRLREKPDDRAALVTAGNYLCLVRGDWQRGRPLLVQANDPPLSEAAALDLANPQAAIDRAAVGDAWWNAGEADSLHKNALRERARFWYELALPGLSGLNATRLQKRLDTIAGEASAGQNNGQVVITIQLPGKIKLRMRRIAAGKFFMGSSPEEIGRATDENLHRVSITKPFYLGLTEVTQAQWSAVMDGNNPSATKGPDLPVDGVTWPEAQRFCQTLNELLTGEKYRFRLPTEAEAEYAMRAGTQSPWFFGDDPQAITQFAWFKGNAGGKTHPVGELKPNAWGFYDVYGNVGEWCQDFRVPFDDKPAVDPVVLAGSAYRAHRGGTFLQTPIELRSAARFGNPPNEVRGYIGLRLAADPAR